MNYDPQAFLDEEEPSPSQRQRPITDIFQVVPTQDPRTDDPPLDEPMPPKEGDPPPWLQGLLTQWQTERNEQQQTLNQLTQQLATSTAAVQQLAANQQAVAQQQPDPALAQALASLADATTAQGDVLSAAVADAADKEPKPLSYIKRPDLPANITFDHSLPESDHVRATSYRLCRTAIFEHVRDWAASQSREIERHIDPQASTRGEISTFQRRLRCSRWRSRSSDTIRNA